MIEVWVDEDDSGTYEAGEMHSMSETDRDDCDFTDCKFYERSLVLRPTGDGKLNYCFHASDGYHDAIGDPTHDSILEITNNAPSLAWSGEPGYTGDGVNPDAAPGGSGFEFRVDYTDPDNDLPSAIEVWVDADDSGTYEEDEKHGLHEAEDDDVVLFDGKRYSGTITLEAAGDGNLNYRFYATDGEHDATGEPTKDSSLVVTGPVSYSSYPPSSSYDSYPSGDSTTGSPPPVIIINNVPALAWTGEAGYLGDGVDPDAAPGGSSFDFRVDYTDADGDTPAAIEVWVDEDDSGTYEPAEKHALGETDPGDADVTDSKRYAASLTLARTGDGVLDYRFFASDGSSDAAGAPVAGATLTVTNNAPALAWTGEAGYLGDGVDPDAAPGGSSFDFRVDYTDADGDTPAAIEVWVDEDDSGTYEPAEKHALGETDTGDADVTDSKRYAASLTLANTGDSNLDYRFYASDGTDDATGAPTSDATVTVTNPNNIPSLAWTGETNYSTDGVNPDSDTSGSNFEFRVTYTDTDNEAPSPIQVWVDMNDDGSYASSEKYDMTGADPGDSDHTDGKIYTKTLMLLRAGDGALDYRFYASDGSDDATGDPSSDSTVVITGTINVPSEYGTIQAAINAANNGDTIVVADGAYPENISFIGKQVTVQAANGAAAASIIGDGSSDAPVVTFASGETASAVLDGFTIDNQTSGGNFRRGIVITSGSTPTIKNSIVRGNDPASYVDGNNIYINGGGATIEDTVIGGVSGTPDTGDYGTGIYATTTTDPISITGGAISYNSGTLGGGIYLTGVSQTTITGTTLTANSASLHGGAIYAANSPLTISGATIDANSSTQDGAALYLTGATTTASITGTSLDGNSGRVGGAFYASGTGDITIASSTIDSNSATSYGAGLYLLNTTGTTVVSDTSISSNTGTASGAGIYLNSTAATVLNLTSVTVDNNTVTNTGSFDGGGMYVSGGSVSVNASGGSVSGNSTRNGGALYLAGGADLSATGTTFNDNTATANGGAINVNGSGTALVLSKCYIQGNSAPDGGGGVYLGAGTSGSVTNCTITGNTVDTDWRYGGGISNFGTLTMYNTTIAGNYAYAMGGGLNANGTETVVNNIIWGNTTVRSNPQINGTAESVTYSDIEGGYAGTGNIDADPALIDLQQASAGSPTSSGDFHIGELTAAVVDTGSAAGAPADDIDGDSRPLGAGVDMGSDEYTAITINYTIAGTATATAASETSIDISMPYSRDDDGDSTYTVQYKLSSSGTWLDWGVNPKAHSASPYSDTITGLTPGESYDVRLTYNDADGVSGTNPQTVSAIVLPGGSTIITVCSSGCDSTTIQTAIDGASNGDIIRVSDGIYSENIDYNGKEVTIESVNGAASTLIQGSGAANAVVTFDTGETAGAVLDGFTIDNQRASTAGARGIKIINGSTPTISNCKIEGNQLVTLSGGDDNYGGGIYINGSGATIENTIIGESGFANNANKGSGIYAVNGLDLTITDSTISYNSGRDYAGMYLNAMSGTTTLTNTNVDNNNANGYNVGGIYAYQSSISITGGSISNNSGTYGGGLRLENVPTITTINGTTINGNSAGGTIAGGIYSIDSPMAISNASISNNSSRDGAGIYMNGSYSGFPAGTKTTIDNTTISGNNANGYMGGGILSDGAPLEITNSSITGNSGRQGSGLRLLNLPLVTVISNTNIDDNIGGAIAGGGIYSNSSPLAITGGSISRNTGSRDGGGIYLTGNYTAYAPGTRTTIDGTTIDANSSGAYPGGGIYSYTCPLSISNSSITNGTASAGGGLYLNALTEITYLDNVTLTGNTGSGSYHGGGIYSTESPMTITSSDISGNYAPREGAGLFISGAYATYPGGTTNTITDCTINGNTGGGSYVGGGIRTSSPLDVERTYIQGNRSGSGGGIYASSTLNVTNSTITGNSADRSWLNEGGGIYNAGTMTVVNSTIAGNYAARYGGGVRGGGTITNSIIWGNTAGTSNPHIYGSPTVTFSDIEGGFAGTGNLDVDPSFVDFQQATDGNPTLLGNFHLLIGSLVIDQATATGAPANDIDGDTRPLGSGIDMGSDEKA